YTAAPASSSRRSVQTALYRIAESLVRLVAPILCFTAEEVWGYLPRQESRLSSVHLALFPEASELSAGLSQDQIAHLRNWDQLIAVRNEVLKALEVARRDKAIGNALEAKVELFAEGDSASLLREYRPMLPMLFIVSQVQLSEGAHSDALETGI